MSCGLHAKHSDIMKAFPLKLLTLLLVVVLTIMVTSTVNDEIFECFKNTDPHAAIRDDTSAEFPDVGNSAPLQQLDFPKDVKTVWINIGTHETPVMPPEDDPSVVVIGYEPILKTATKIPEHPRLFIIVAAVDGSDRTHMQTMKVYNKGASSTLAPTLADPNAEWALPSNLGDRPPSAFVPVHPMSLILDSIPENLQIDFLKTDMQGYDFAAIKSAGRKLQRVRRIISECTNKFSYYIGNENDCLVHFKPYLTSLGYRQLSTDVAPGTEGDVEFVRIEEDGQNDVTVAAAEIKNR